MTLVQEEKHTFYETPKYPDFPYGEWQARISNAQRLMGENEVDCLALWSRENINYFSAFQTGHWWLPSLQPAILILFVDREPIIVVPRMLLGTAEGLCWVRDMRIYERPHEYHTHRELPKKVADLIKGLGYGRKNIGLETGPLGCMWIPRPLCDIDAFRDALSDARFVDGDKVIWGCRMIKSPLEIERIRKSVEGIRAIEATLVEEFRPGMTEVELSKILHLKAAQLDGVHLRDNVQGLKGHLSCSEEREAILDVGAIEGVTITKGDCIAFDMSLIYRGYLADSGRVFQVGPITDTLRRNYELIWECQSRVADILTPGVKANEVFHAFYDPIEAAGFRASDMAGHGVGLINHEPPSIDAWNEMVIEEGMALSIEGGISRRRGADVSLHIQDTFVVTDKGCYKLEGLRRDIIQVSHPIL